MKNVGKFFDFIFNVTRKGFYSICLVFSRGFYFYFYIVVVFLKKIFRKSKKLDELANYYKNRQENPEYFFLLLLGCVLLFATIYVYFFDSNEVVKLDGDMQSDVIKRVQEGEEIEENETDLEQKLETNLYKIYGNMKMEQINFDDLRNTNSDVVMWLSVDGTNINYPIVHTSDNDYYLNHDFNKKKTTKGWPFLDYRNAVDLSDKNSIFYGHNLLNKTAFGSIANLFTENWFNSSNHRIVVYSGNVIYTYEIFSVYYSSPESYYLQVEFRDDNSYEKFINTLKGRSLMNFATTVSKEDKIITLSTCTDDNKGRKVVHAKLISQVNV